MDRFAALTGRRYGLFDYVGHPEAERVIVHHGLGRRDGARDRRRGWSARGEKVGVLKVRLYRPFSMAAFAAALPPTVDGASRCSTAPRSRARSASRSIWTWSPRSREARADGGSALAADPGDRRPLRAVVEGVHPGDGQGGVRRAAPQRSPTNHFTVGIMDDVTHTSLAVSTPTSTSSRGRDAGGLLRPGRRRHGRRQQELDQDHRRGDRPHAQGYFVYDSKKSGAVTISHLRFGPRADPLAVPDRASAASWPATSSTSSSVSTSLEHAAPGAVFLLNAPYAGDEVWDHLPREVQEQIVDKRCAST